MSFGLGFEIVALFIESTGNLKFINIWSKKEDDDFSARLKLTYLD